MKKAFSWTVEVPEGDVFLILRDKLNRETRAPLHGVKSRPEMPRNFKTGEPHLDRLAEGLWLAQEAGPEWRIEAIRTLQPLVEEKNRLARDISLTLLFETTSRNER